MNHIDLQYITEYIKKYCQLTYMHVPRHLLMNYYQTYKLVIFYTIILCIVGCTTRNISLTTNLLKWVYSYLQISTNWCEYIIMVRRKCQTCNSPNMTTQRSNDGIFDAGCVTHYNINYIISKHLCSHELKLQVSWY